MACESQSFSTWPALLRRLHVETQHEIPSPLSVKHITFAMQSQLHSSFQRVEQALQRLTDSIAAYNPDVLAADELAAADEAVSEDLKKRAPTTA